MSFTFQKATRKRVKLRLALVGPSGSGKTLGALKIATGLGGRIAVIDTEAGNVSSYSDEFDFDVLEIAPPFSPERFIEAVELASAGGYDICIIDSMSAEWEGSGGCLEINEKTAAARYKGNTWSAWSDTTPRHRAFISSLLQSRMDIISTMRSTTETVQGDDKRVRKVGMKAEQRKGTEYDFQFVFDIDHQTHLATASTNRSKLFGEPAQITVGTGKQLKEWRESAVEAPPSEAEIVAKRREDISHRFAAALNPTADLGDTEESHEAAVAVGVMAVHNELREYGIEEYGEVWKQIPAPSRAAIKKYLDAIKKQEKAA